MVYNGEKYTLADKLTQLVPLNVKSHKLNIFWLLIDDVVLVFC